MTFNIVNDLELYAVIGVLVVYPRPVAWHYSIVVSVVAYFLAFGGLFCA